MKLKAGNEMDALIADKVMGWTGREHELWVEKATGKVTDWGTENCSPASSSLMFRPSTEVAPAMLVIDYLRKQGCDVVLRLNATRINKPFVRIEFSAQVESFISDGTLLPFAICVGALKVMGVEVA